MFQLQNYLFSFKIFIKITNLLEFLSISSLMKTETTIPRLASRKQPDKTRLHPSLLKKNAPAKYDAISTIPSTVQITLYNLKLFKN